VFVPNGDTELTGGDQLSVLGQTADLGNIGQVEPLGPPLDSRDSPSLVTILGLHCLRAVPKVGAVGAGDSHVDEHLSERLAAPGIRQYCALGPVSSSASVAIAGRDPRSA
jgi:hypothetical protein